MTSTRLNAWLHETLRHILHASNWRRLRGDEASSWGWNNWRDRMKEPIEFDMLERTLTIYMIWHDRWWWRHWWWRHWWWRHCRKSYRNVSCASSCTISSKRSRLGTQLCIKWQFWSSTHPPSLANLSPGVIRKWQSCRLFLSRRAAGRRSQAYFHVYDEIELSDYSSDKQHLVRKG